jgi:hypothetical protein
MPSVQIVSPAPGEKLYVGTTYNIQWNSSGATMQRVQYSIDGGNNFIPIQTGLGPNVRQFAWTIPSGIVPDGQSAMAAVIRIVVRDANAIEATSASSVTIATAEIISILPNHGPTTGNTLVSITGKGFAPGCNVKFGEVEGLNTQVLNSTQIQTFTPSGVAGGVDVKVKNAGVPGVTRSNGFTYDLPAGPMISNVDPVRGPITGNTAVTITGSNFDAQVNVKFGELDGVITQKSATLIKVNSPAVAVPGAVPLKVKNPNVQAVTAATFIYDPLPPPAAPRIDGISPVVGPATRSIPVVIAGANFVSGCEVLFGGTNAQSVTFHSASQLTVQTPTNVIPGRVRVKVVNPDQTSAKRDDGFEFVAAPVVSQVDPPEGPRAGNIMVRILGMNFQPGATVRFGNTPSLDTPVVSPEGTSITCRLPPGEKGSIAVKVTNPAPDLQQGKLDAGFLYLGPQQEQAARIFSISPKTILLKTETMMTVKGRNLQKAMDQGTFAVRGPNENFAKVEMRGWNVTQLPGTQEDVVTFFLTIKRDELSLAQRVPYYVVASVRPESKDDRIFEASRKGQFILVTNSSPVIFGVTAQLIEGAANMILLSGRNLRGSTIALTDKSGAAIPVSYVSDREDLLIAGLTLDDNMTQGTNTTANLTLMGPGQSPVGDPIPIEIMPGGPADGDNDMPGVGQLKPAPKQQVMTVPEQNVGLFAFSSSGSGGSWLPGSPVFAAPFVDYAPVAVSIFDFAIELVSDSIVVPAFGRSGKPQVGVVAQLRGVPLIIHLEITLFVTIRVFVFRQGNPFPSTSIGDFNEFADSVGDAFGTYLAFVTVSARELEAGFVIALVRPDDQLERLVSGGLDFQFSQDKKRLMIGGSIILGAHINSIRPLTGDSNLSLAAPAVGASPIKDLASFKGFFFPTEAGRACANWEFNVQFTNQFLDGTPVDPSGQSENLFVVRLCTKVVLFPGELLRLRIEPDSFVLNGGESATATAVDTNGNPSPIPVTFKLDSPGQAVANLGLQTSNSVQLIAAPNVSGGGRISASVSPPAGFGLLPLPGFLFSFSAATGVSVEFDSAMVTVGMEATTITITKPGMGDMFDCDEAVQCQGIATQGNRDLSNMLQWETPNKKIVNLCKFQYADDKLKFAERAAAPVYRRRSLDYSTKEEFLGADIKATLPGTNANPAVVTINCRDANGKPRCKAWREREKTGALARLVHVIAVEGLNVTATERRQIGYAAANIWRYGRCFRFKYNGVNRRPTSLEDGVFSIQEFERNNVDPQTRANYQRFDPNTGAGPNDCTECINYADAVAAAKEILADKRSTKEFAAQFPNKGRPSHAVAFDRLDDAVNSENPNTEPVFLIGRQKIEGDNLACQSYRRLKIPAIKINLPAPNATFKTCSDLIVEWAASGTEQFAELIANNQNTLITIKKSCPESVRGTYNIPASLIPKGQTKLNAIVRITVRNRVVLKDSEAELTGAENELGELSDERVTEVPITIELPPLTVEIRSPQKDFRAAVDQMLQIVWKSTGTEKQEVLISFDGGTKFEQITDFPLDCGASSFNWKVRAPETQARLIPAIIRVEVTNVNGSAHSDVPISIVVTKKAP